MKRLLFFFFCIALIITANGQSNYAEAMQQGDNAFKNGQYKAAINKYFAAEAFDPTKKDSVKAKVNRVFDAIENLRKKAEDAQAEADRNLKNFKALKETVIGANYQGGIVFYWNDQTGKHGLVASEMDLDSTYSWQEASEICKRLKIKGYSNWRLPTKEELSVLYANRIVVGGFSLNDYWSSTEIPEAIAWSQSFQSGIQYNVDQSDRKNSVRVVRAF